MRRCPGLHCDGCGDGGGPVLIAVLVVLAIIGAVVHAIWHQLVEAVEIVALVLVSGCGLAVAAGGVYLAMRIRARQLEVRARRTVPARAQVIRLGEPPIVIDSTTGQAIEAPRQRTAGWPLAGRWEEINPSTDRRTS